MLNFEVTKFHRLETKRLLMLWHNRGWWIKVSGYQKVPLRNISRTRCSLNSSPSKLRRVSLATQPKVGVGQSPISEKAIDSCEEGEYDYACEIVSPVSKSRWISLVRRKKMKLEFSPEENNDCYRKIPTSSILVAAC